MKLFATWPGKLLAAAAAIMLLYTSIGFLVFPAIIKRAAVQELTKFLGRAVAIRKIDFNPYAMSIAIRGLQLEEQKGGAVLSWDALHVTIAPLSSLFHRLWILKEAVLIGPSLNIVRNAGGSLNISDFFRVDWPKNIPFHLLHMRLADGKVFFRDEAVPGGFSTTISHLTANVNDFSTSPGHENSFSISAVSDQREKISWTGFVRLNPLSSRGEIAVENAPIIKYAPYLEERFEVTITDGTLSARMAYDVDLDPDRFHVLLHDGSIAAHSLTVREHGSTAPLFAFADLALSGAQVDVVQHSITVASVIVTGGSAVIRRRADNSLNVEHLIRPASTPSVTRAASSANWNVTVGEIRLANFAAEVNHVFGRQTMGWKDLRISKPTFQMNPLAASMAAATLHEGALVFTDPSLQPPVKMALTHLDIRIGGLSSANSRSASVAVSARIGSLSKLQISGVSNPINGQGETNVRGLLQNVNLVPLSPYAAKYLGYTLAEGTLTLDIAVLMTRRTLNVRNAIVIDRLTFGEKTESRDATKLPVRLAVALLQDTSGKISLNIPIEIPLDDSTFTPLNAIIEAVLTPFKKTAASPFAALGAQLKAGGEELGFQIFASGSAELEPQETGKLDTILLGLKRWPEFMLDIEGSVDVEKDTGDLQLLAANRAKTVKEYLIRKGTLERDRIFLIDNSLENVPRRGSRALLSLKDKYQSP